MHAVPSRDTGLYPPIEAFAKDRLRVSAIFQFGCALSNNDVVSA